MPSRPRSLPDLLKDRFAAKHVDALIRHYSASVEHFQKSEWEDAVAKSGKFVEAVLKALWINVGETVPAGKLFKAGSIMDKLVNKSGAEESIRLTIPRACRITYEIASNRGGRHDPDEIDPNEMDATLAVSNCSWILAEMVRIAQRGLGLARVQELVSGLVRKRYPMIEEVGDRIYVSLKGLSARDIAVLVLWHKYPRRLGRNELVETLKRHKVKAHNADVAIGRLAGIVDVDENGQYRLLSSGMREAEALIKEQS